MMSRSYMMYTGIGSEAGILSDIIVHDVNGQW